MSEEKNMKPTTAVDLTQEAPETAPKTNAGAPGTAAQKIQTDKETAKVLQEAEKINKELTAKYGKQPSKESILQEFKKSDTFKDCKTYEDVLKTIKEGKDPDNKNTDGQSRELYEWLKKNVRSAEEIEKQSEKYNRKKIYGANPDKTMILHKLQELEPTVYKDADTYEKAMEILAVRRPPAHKWITEHVVEDHPLRNASDEELDKELKERGFDDKDKLPKEEEKKEETKKIEKETITPTTEKTKPKKTKEKSEKKSWWIFKKIGKWIARPFKTAGKAIIRPIKNIGKIGKTIGKTARTPIGLLSYLLADIGEKEKTGRKDRRAGYKKIREGKK